MTKKINQKQRNNVIPVHTWYQVTGNRSGRENKNRPGSDAKIQRGLYSQPEI